MAMVAPSCENVLSLVGCGSVLEDLWHDHDLPGLLAVVVGGPVDDVEDEEEDGEEDEEEAVHLGVALALPPRHAVLVVVPGEENDMLGLELTEFSLPSYLQRGALGLTQGFVISFHVNSNGRCAVAV